jgi:hypothetical protein
MPRPCDQRTCFRLPHPCPRPRSLRSRLFRRSPVIGLVQCAAWQPSLSPNRCRVRADRRHNGRCWVPPPSRATAKESRFRAHTSHAAALRPGRCKPSRRRRIRVRPRHSARLGLAIAQRLTRCDRRATRPSRCRRWRLRRPPLPQRLRQRRLRRRPQLQWPVRHRRRSRHRLRRMHPPRRPQRWVRRLSQSAHATNRPPRCPP